MADYETFSSRRRARPAGGIGGMMGAPPGTPSHWLAYFAVADADAAVSAVGDGGGRVLLSPEDTPRAGRGGDDPFGATFGLIGPALG